MNYNLSIINKKYKYVNNKFPVTVFIKITSKCLFKCHFCSQGDSCNEEISIEDMKIILNKLKRNGVLRIFYTGGEPFLHTKFLEIVKYGKELGFCQLVITNGYLLEKKSAKQILKYIDCLSISIHGTESFHNIIVENKHSYEKIISGIEMLKKEFPEIILDMCFTASKENATKENIESVAKLCKKYNLLLTITRAYIIGKEKNHDFSYIKPMIQTIDKLINKGYKIEIGHCLVPCALNDNATYLTSCCTAGINFCAIDINGDVKICANSNQVIGNVLNTRFKKIWRKNNNILNKHINNLSIKCKNCSYFVQCAGGCKCEDGTMENGNADLLYFYILEKEWQKIYNFYIKTQIAEIKKVATNKYLLIGKNNCIINNKTYKMIKKIDFSKTFIENQQISKIDKELLLQLYKDGFLGVVENEKIYIK